MTTAKRPGRRRLLATAFFVFCAYLTAESLMPPAAQPTAWASQAAIRGYQTLGSPLVGSMGIRCRYTPTCSHYATDAIGHYGTLGGWLRTSGRLWRCSPWGGMGYDPAVALQDETPAERRRREERQRTLDELNQRTKQGPAPAPAASAAGWLLSCGLGVALLLALIAGSIVFVVKDTKARGDTTAAVWTLLCVFLPGLGPAIYLAARTKGPLAPCATCKRRKLELLTACPHCGAAKASA